MTRKRRASSRQKGQPRRSGETPDSGGPLRWLATLLRWTFKAGILLAIWGSVALGGIAAYYAADLPDIRQVVQQERRPSMTLLAEDGSLLARYGDIYGQRVTLKDVPPHLVHAIIAIEDRRFYQHFGIDLFGILRAAVQNVIAGRMVQGGSTLTQQLAKNLFLTPERKFSRKIKEMLLALWLEHTYTKDQILSAYLNRVYLGAGTYGVDAAAETYFGKPVSAISLRESAILAGLLRAPSRFSPANNQAEAMARAKVVLGAMEEAGYISEKEKKAALADIPLPRRKPGAGGDGHYFADWVLDQASALLGDTPQDLVIDTTLDIKLQRAAERHLDATLASGKAMAVTQGALVTLAPDGAVRVMVGGRDYGESQFNRATQAQRQPGSSFKPIIYLAALEDGLSPDDMFDDAPLRIGKWAPENYDGKFRGPITARQALAESVNTVAVKVLQQAGLPRAIQTAHALGIASPMGHDLSLALGANDVTPLEMTSAYASIAAGGRAITPYAIKEIRNRDGQVLYRRQPVNPPVVAQPHAVATLVDMMGDVIRYGTGKRAALDRPAAGKTGTSSDYRDAWFLGFTADYVTGVWLGNDDNDPMKKVTGGSLPAQLWRDYMIEAEIGLPPRDLMQDMPEGRPQERPEPDEPSSSTNDILGDFIRDLTGADKVAPHDFPSPRTRGSLP